MNAVTKPRVRVNAHGEVRPAPAMGFGGGTNTRDAARHDLTEFSGWRPPLRFAGSANYAERNTIMARGRDLDENNGWINGGLDRRVESVIGVNIRLSAQPRYTLLNRDHAWRMDWAVKVQDRFTIWANDIHKRCDARMKLPFGALARLAYLTYIRDGEMAAEIRDISRGISNPTSILLFEPERISTPDWLTENKNLRNGIVMDDNGAVMGYWVRNTHPNDPDRGFEGQRWSYIPAMGPTGRTRIIHVFNPRRAEQNRGISRLAEVMVPAKMLDRVDRAEVNAALKAALFSIFIKSPGTTEDLEAALAPTGSDAGVDPWVESYLSMRERSPVFVDSAQVTHLLPDEDVVVPNATHPNSNFPEFTKTVLQKVAASLGVSYPQMSQNWADINYSSARALLNELWRSFKEDRHFFTQAFCTPVYAAWLEWEVANGDVKVPGGPVGFYKNKTAICMAEWIGPGRGSVDPLKEANANNLDTAAGRKSTVECILEDGRDPSDVMQDELWLRNERERLGLPALNHNVKASDAGGEDGASSSGTEADRDGDGIANEEQRKRKGPGTPAGQGDDQ